MRLATIIKKNFKILIRSRTSALIVILGPLLIIVLAGLAFNNMSSYNVKIGVFSNNYNELTNSFIDVLKQRDYQVNKFEAPEYCVETIKQGDIHACIIFPDDFRLDNEVSNEITFYVDYSKTNLVYMILESVSGTIGMRSEELSMELTTQILDVLQYTKNTINEKSNVINRLVSDSSSLETKISSMNLATPEVSTGVLLAGRKTIERDVSSLKNKTDEIVDKTYLIINLINNESLTAELESDVDELNESFYELHEESLEDLDKLNSTIQTFEKNLNDLDENLANARTLKANAVNLAEDIKEDLNDMKSSLEGIKERIDNLKVTEAGTIVSPITTNIEPVVPEKTYLSYLFPSLVIMLILLVCLMLSSNLVIMEKTSRAYFRNFTTPTRDIFFIGAHYLTTFIVALLQVMLVMAIAAFIFKTALLTNILLILIIVFLSISLFTFIGLIIGHFYNSEETASIASISIASLFLLLSNLILPLESMPQTVIKIAQYNPFVVASELLKKAVLFNATIQNIYMDLAILAGYCVVIFLILILVQQMSKIRFFRGIKRKKEVTEEEKILKETGKNKGKESENNEQKDEKEHVDFKVD